MKDGVVKRRGEIFFSLFKTGNFRCGGQQTDWRLQSEAAAWKSTFYFPEPCGQLGGGRSVPGGSLINLSSAHKPQSENQLGFNRWNFWFVKSCINHEISKFCENLSRNFHHREKRCSLVEDNVEHRRDWWTFKILTFHIFNPFHE